MSNLSFWLDFKNNSGKQEYRTGYKEGDSEPKYIIHPKYMINYNLSNKTYLLLVNGLIEGYT